MAGKGKISLRRIIKSEHEETKNCIQALCFPQIAERPIASNGQRVFPQESFERLRLTEMKSLAAKSAFDQTLNTIGTNGGSSVPNPHEQAFNDGYAQGQKAGMEMATSKIEPMLNSFKQAAAELEKIRKQLYRNAERQAVDLALAVARKIICHEVNVNRTVVLDVVKEALKRVADHDQILIRVNPGDVETMKDPRCQLSALVDHVDSILVEPDMSIPAGGCVIETQLGNIDARIEEQLKAVEEAFKAELKKCEGKE